MEFFEAAGVGASEGSRRKLDGADVYVGIFAHRYGYVEAGYDRSVTEIEFDYAAERGLDRLCFLVDPSFPWPPDAWDYQQYELLEAFKARVETSLIRAKFTTVDNFALLLFQALDEWRTNAAAPQVSVEVDAAGGETGSRLPPSPPLVVGRDTDLEALKERVLRAGSRTVVRGWPGVGKTTTVLALVRDPEIEAAFPDGVLWASLGETPDPVAELLAWSAALGSPLTPATLPDAIDRVRDLLRDRRALLIVDDVWTIDAALAFAVAGSECATLYTTRFADLTRELAQEASDVYLLAQLADDEALALFTRLAPTAVAADPDAVRKLVEDLEGLPLALRVAARLLEVESAIGWSIEDLLTELATGTRLLQERAPEDRFDPVTGTLPSVSALLRQSTDRLDEETRDRFAFLGAFAPKPATFDLEAMEAIWLVDDARPTARSLADRGLLEPLIGTGRFQLHAVLALHAKSLLQ
jgi:hypothetical protein